MRKYSWIAVVLAVVALALPAGAASLDNPQSLLPILVPTASLVIDTGTVNGAGTVTVTDTTGAVVTNKVFDWGDSTSSTGIVASYTHTYTSSTNAAVTRTITLTEYGLVSTSQATTSVVVNPYVQPSALANVAFYRARAGMPVPFWNLTTNAITYAKWSFGDGNTTNTLASMVTHVYTNSAAGTNTVSLIVSNSVGASTNTLTMIVYTNSPSGGWWTK